MKVKTCGHNLSLSLRARKRIFHKERKSDRWKKLDKLFKTEAKNAKADFYKSKVEELKKKNPKQWYSCLKNITSFDQFKNDQPNVEEIRHLSDQEQADIIANQFAKIQNEYEPLKKDDIKVPPFSEDKFHILARPRFGLHCES